MESHALFVFFKGILGKFRRQDQIRVKKKVKYNDSNEGKVSNLCCETQKSFVKDTSRAETISRSAGRKSSDQR